MKHLRYYGRDFILASHWRVTSRAKTVMRSSRNFFGFGLEMWYFRISKPRRAKACKSSTPRTLSEKRKFVRLWYAMERLLSDPLL